MLLVPREATDEHAAVVVGGAAAAARGAAFAMALGRRVLFGRRDGVCDRRGVH